MIFLLVSVAVFILILYFLPALIANQRNHPNQWPIFIINLFFGCTLVGWVIALAWACTRIHNSEIYELNAERRILREKMDKLEEAYLRLKAKSEA